MEGGRGAKRFCGFGFVEVQGSAFRVSVQGLAFGLGFGVGIGGIFSPEAAKGCEGSLRVLGLGVLRFKVQGLAGLGSRGLGIWEVGILGFSTF